MSTFLTAGQLDDLLAMTIEYVERSPILFQNIQAKPLLRDLMKNTGTFPGNPGKQCSWTVVFDYERAEHPWEGDEKLKFYTPSGVKRAVTNARNRHLGLRVPHDMLSEYGVSLVDTNSGLATKDHMKAASVKLHDPLRTMVKMAMEGRERDRQEMLWSDGSDSRLNVPGVKYWIHDDPTAAVVVAGLDQGVITGWRNRSSLGIIANKSNASEQTLVTRLSQEYRQLRKFGGGPNKSYAGSDFLEQLENELRARGSYTDSGWSKSGTIDISADDVDFKGMRFEYDPTLDDIGEAKRMYWLQIGEEGLQVMFMDGKKEQVLDPAREHDRLVSYRSFITTMATRMKSRQGSGVYSIA